MTQENDIKPGDYVTWNGQRGIAVHAPQVVVVFENLSIALVPLHSMERSSSKPDIKYEDFLRAKDRWPEVKP